MYRHLYCSQTTVYHTPSALDVMSDLCNMLSSNVIETRWERSVFPQVARSLIGHHWCVPKGNIKLCILTASGGAASFHLLLPSQHAFLWLKWNHLWFNPPLGLDSLLDMYKQGFLCPLTWPRQLRLGFLAMLRLSLILSRIFCSKFTRPDTECCVL